jgi:hypothetical protein
MDSFAVSPCRVVALPIGDASCTPLVSSPSGGILKRLRAWCNKSLGEDKAGGAVDGETHGICPECMARELSEVGLCA